MKQMMKIVALVAIFAASSSVFAQAAAATATATASASAKSTATNARDSVRAAKDVVDEALASLAVEEKAIGADQKGVANLALADRPAAQKALDERKAALIIAKKRLAQVADRCTAPVATVPKKASVATSHVSSVTHENAALKARIIALEQKASATATASASANAGASSASATATAIASANSNVLTFEGGCGVKLAGRLIQELAPRTNSTCALDRAILVKKFLAQCHGKGGSDDADIVCGKKLTLD